MDVSIRLLRIGSVLPEMSSVPASASLPDLDSSSTVALIRKAAFRPRSGWSMRRSRFSRVVVNPSGRICRSVNESRPFRMMIRRAFKAIRSFFSSKRLPMLKMPDRSRIRWIRGFSISNRRRTTFFFSRGRTASLKVTRSAVMKSEAPSFSRMTTPVKVKVGCRRNEREPSRYRTSRSRAVRSAWSRSSRWVSRFRKRVAIIPARTASASATTAAARRRVIFFFFVIVSA